MITLEDLAQWLNAPAETKQLDFKCFNANADQATSMLETLINQGKKCFNAKIGDIAKAHYVPVAIAQRRGGIL